MIHFKLKDIDSVIPIGNDLNWFSLTDGELYLNVENYKLFEYTSQAMQYFDDKTSPYIDLLHRSLFRRFHPTIYGDWRIYSRPFI